MSYELTSFGQLYVWIIAIVIACTVFVREILVRIMQHSRGGETIGRLLLEVGVSVHEAAHLLMCKVFGVEVKDYNLFKVEHTWIGEKKVVGFRGYVQCGEISSTLTALFLGIAPLLLNGTLVVLIIYYSPLWIEIDGLNLLLPYLGITLCLGARPSTADITASYRAFRRCPGRGLLDILLLCIFGVVCYSFTLYQTELLVSISVVVVFIGLFVVTGRLGKVDEK